MVISDLKTGEADSHLGRAVMEKVIATVKGYLEYYDTNSVPFGNGELPAYHQSIRIKDFVKYGRVACMDDMGTGKTLIPVRAKPIFDQMNGRKPALVIAPKSSMDDNERLHGAWSQSEIDKYSSTLGMRRMNVLPIFNRGDFEKFDSNTDFVVINYDKLSRDAEGTTYMRALMQMDLGMIVPDEAHHFGNPNTQRFAAAKPLIEKYKNQPLFLASGTMPANSFKEFKSYLWMLNPDKYPDPREWRFDDDIGALRRMLDEHHWYRITRHQLKEQLGLGDFHDDQTLHVELTDEEALAYFEVWKNCAFLGDKMIRLRQCEYNPGILPQFAEQFAGHVSSKRIAINRSIEQAVDEGQSVLVYLPLKTGIIDDFVADNRRFGAIKIEGDTKYRARFELGADFKSEQARVAFITRVMSESRDLSLGDRPAKVIYAEPPWDPREYMQPAGRVWRRGQRAPVTIENVVTQSAFLNELMESSIDELVAEHGIKRPKHFTPRTISYDKLRLVRYKLAAVEKFYAGNMPENWEQRLFEARTEDDARAFMEGMVSLPKLERPSSFKIAIMMQSMWRGIGEEGYRKLVNMPIAGKYANLYTDGWDETFSATTNKAIARMIAAEEQYQGRQLEIADIGSAFGCLSQALYTMDMPRSTTLVDIDPKMLALARKQARKNRVHNTYVNATATDTTLRDSSLDVAVLSYVMHYLDNINKREIEDALLEQNRILAPGGLMIVALPYTVEEDHIDRFTKGLTGYGFYPLPFSGFYRSGSTGNYFVAARALEKVEGYKGNAEDFVLYSTRKKLSGAAETRRSKVWTGTRNKQDETFVRKGEHITLDEAIQQYLAEADK